ncbi:hypothetical protein [Thiocystis minor]|uniref:hypothetical protein n=1 Tax=Thiocystis minor TaxID=61597 RepID=UPI001A93644B|nr:hypothetical protein [Thiocystis minor]
MQGARADRLADPPARLHTPGVGEGTPAGSSQIARTVFWSNHKVAASASAWSWRGNALDNGLIGARSVRSARLRWGVLA